MKTECKYERKNKTITTLESGEKKSYPSIALAKKASKELQGSALGNGLVRVVK